MPKENRNYWSDVEFNSGTELGENLSVRHAPDRQCGALGLFDGTMYLGPDTSRVPVCQFQRTDRAVCLQ